MWIFIFFGVRWCERRRFLGFSLRKSLFWFFRVSYFCSLVDLGWKLRADLWSLAKKVGVWFYFFRVEGGGHRRRRWRPSRATVSPMKVARRWWQKLQSNFFFFFLSEVERERAKRESGMGGMTSLPLISCFLYFIIIVLWRHMAPLGGAVCLVQPGEPVWIPPTIWWYTLTCIPFDFWPSQSMLNAWPWFLHIQSTFDQAI